MKARRPRAGSMSIQFAIILVPVIFGFMGFAVDLGRIYLIRGELNQAASAMALAAAANLNGTQQATTTASSAASATIDAGLTDSNKYNFGSLIVGQGDALLAEYSPTMNYYSSLTDAAANGSAADSTTARFASVTLTADAPLLFWGLFNFGQSRKTTLAMSAIAGVSAPVCTACGIEPFAIAPVNAADTTDFGFISGNLYTFGYQCTGAAPALLAGTTAPRIPYILINGYNTTGLAEPEDQQLFQTGAQGLLPTPFSPTSLSCATIGTAETLWASAPARACNAAGASASVQDALCGLSTRLTGVQPAACTSNNDLTSVSDAYAADTDAAYITDYTAYQGNNRRLMTVPVVDAIGTLSVLGFRQFLLEPNSDGTPNNPADANGRFIAMYVGVVCPVKQGRFDGGCAVTSGPGKAVLHQ